MREIVKIPKVVLALLCCIAFSSCAKDTDLISGYIINSSHQKKEVSQVKKEQKVLVTVPEVDVKIKVFSKVETPKWKKIEINQEAQQVVEVLFTE